MDRIRKERIRRIRVTPSNNDFQEIFTFRREKMVGAQWRLGRVGEETYGVESSSSFFSFLLAQGFSRFADVPLCAKYSRRGIETRVVRCVTCEKCC